MRTPEPGQVFRMDSTGKFFEVENRQGERVSGFYVDHTGKMLAPPKQHEATFTVGFLESYATRWNLA